LNFVNLNLKKIIFFIFVFILPLITINMEQRHDQSEWFNQPFTWLAGGMQNLFFDYSKGIKDSTARYVNLINIKKDNESLQGQNKELQTRLLKLDEILAENNRLKSILDFKQNSKMDLVSAQVIARDLIPDHSTITINKGTDHGVKSGQAVMTLEGALGYIYKPSKKTAHVLLMTDRYAVIDGIIQRSRAQGIVEGKGNSGAVLKYVERTEDVKPGDLVVTGGLDNIFPKGFPIAIVEATEKKHISVSLKVDLKPLVDPDKVEEVFVVLSAANQDLTELLATETKN
jgi:rod shape-determining protein MreC